MARVSIPACLAVVILAGTASPAAAGPLALDSALEKAFDRLSWRSDRGNHRFSISGRLVFDSATYSGGDLTGEDGSEVRRNRISASARLWSDWRVRASWELSGGSPEWRNASIGYRGFEKTRIVFGQQREPFGLGQSSFMEQASPAVLAPGYSLGATASTYRRRWSLAGGVFGGTLASDRDEGTGVGARVTVAPIMDNTSVLHLGVSLNLREPEAGTFRIRSRPESHVTDLRFVNTGRIREVDKRTLRGLEMAFVRERYSFQAEHMEAKLRRRNGRQDLAFSGWYAQAASFVGDESRSYRRSSGRFRHVRPGSRRAIELALRYSELDLEDAEVKGGRGRIWTLGASWYYSRFLRVMANYSVFRGSRELLSSSPRALQVRLEFRMAP